METFDLELWILEQRLQQAQANTDRVIKELFLFCLTTEFNHAKMII